MRKQGRDSLGRIRIKDIIGLLATAWIIWACFYVYGKYVEAEFYRRFMEEYDTDNERQALGGKCVMPPYDAHDPRFLQYVHSFPPINCGNVQPYLTYMDRDGYIRWNSSGIKAIGLRNSELRCFYQEVWRVELDDLHVKLESPIEFRNATKVNSDFVAVECRRSPNGEVIYKMFHSQVPALASKDLSGRKKGPSILILAFDSMSRLNFINQLPNTYRFLEETLKSYKFLGLTKTGDNTYPNIMPLLSGLAAFREVYGDQVPSGIPFWGPKSWRHENFDDVPFVWKNFSRAGYVTMYAEDLPYISTFNTKSKGFFRQPTDYYIRPFFLAFDHFQEFKSRDWRCCGNFPIYQYMLNYTEEFVHEMSDVSYFAFSFLSVLSHDHLNSIQVADDDIFAFLERLWSSGALENTVTIVMGDHGNRFDSVRTSGVGRIEERLPFFALSLPESLRASHPHLNEGLLSNRESLMSWFDIYELLMDFAMENLGEVSRVKRWGAVGLSPLRQLPDDRNCADVGIPRTYCLCGEEKELDTGERRVFEAAEALLAHINYLVDESAEGNKCSRLRLHKILSAQLLLPPSPIPNGFVVETRVSIQLSPGGSQFEGLLQKDAWSIDGGRVMGDVNRINKYGNQSHCTSDTFLKPFCFCEDLIT
ncbi:uncharacterized protein LOC124165441 [Ischnura elegans]|uniref:uncharacterized protein LOC124165441 n=1 Tax=Ischnura elegans TaxID=197161 RepID=UPI001ED86FDF|nr:uncharacterized protein LOC124165441 [Ischnura elegans]